MVDARRTHCLLLLLLVMVGCTPSPGDAATSATATPPPPTLAPCTPEPIAIPTPPADIPGYAELDPTTGLHVTGTAPEIDFGRYRLVVTGQVDNPLNLSYDDLRCMPRMAERCTIICPGFFQDEAVWAGASLDHILVLAGVQKGATGLRLKGADGYGAIVFMQDLSTKDSFLAYEWEGEPLPIIHGFPVRAVFPSLNGNTWVKWLVEIEVY